MSSPTIQTYREWQEAFDFFNQALFGGRLRPCMITLTRKKRTLGYFSPERFVTLRGQVAHEIAMNPAYFAERSPEEVLSTLAHEMCHQLQYDITPEDKRPKRGYHNLAWGDMMIDIGLYPSNTGKPGGKRTGEQMTHYVIEGGPFIVACRELLARGHRITWLDRYIEHLHELDVDPPDEPEEDEDELVDAPVVDFSPAPLAANAGVFKPLVKDDASGSRQRYTCPGCRVNVWGGRGLMLHCLKCGQDFVKN